MKEPYQIFFPLGVLWGIAGVLNWVLFYFHILPQFPAVLHAEMMMGGFYLTFATGFLMTAVPRMSGTASASKLEKGIPFFISLIALAVSWNPHRIFFHALLIAQMLMLIRFGVKRILKGPFKPAPSFALAAIGNLSAFAGGTLLLINDFHPCSPQVLFLARGLLFYVFFLGGVLGIGSLLIPMILGSTPLPQAPTPLSAPKLRITEISKYAFFGLLLIASFIVEIFWGTRWGALIRACVITYLLTTWPLFRLPPKGILYWILWISGWCLMIGFWPSVIRPDLAVHANHLIFIGTVSLMIFGISTRVTLTHGGLSRLPEKNSKALMVVLVLLILALITRVFAVMAPDYASHLAYASLFWICGALVWLVRFGRALLFQKG